MTPYRHSSPPPSWPTSLHRTSSSREDILPASGPLHPQQHPSSLSIHQNTPAQSESRQFKREQLQPPPPPPPPPPPAPPQSQKDSDDNMPATSDFVKKLYKMLEDQSFSHVVSWGPNGDCFVVKDMNEFTKSILPRMFKHSNFASFVRQLNKYDFHKVKNTDDTQFGEHSWTFRHPDFHADRREALENIKRKVPAARKPAQLGSGIGPSTLGRLQQQVAALQSQNDSLRTQLCRSEDRVRGLERCYKDVLGEMVHFQRNLAQQDGLMQSLVQYFLRAEGGESPYFFGHSMTPNTHPPPSMFGMSTKISTTAAAMSATLLASQQQPQPSPFLQPLTASHSQHMLGSHGHGHGPHGPPTTSASSSTLFRALSRSQAQAQAQAQAQSQSPSPSVSQAQGQAQGPAEPPIQSIQSIPSMQEQISSMRETIPLSQTIPSMQSPMQESMSSLPQATSMQQMVNGTGSGNGTRPEGTDMTSGDAPFLIPPDTSWDGTVQTVHEGLQVFTLGHLLPRSALDDANGNWTYDGNGCADEDGVGGIGDCEGEGFEKEESPGAEEVVRPTPTNPGVRESSSATSGATTPSTGGGQKLRVRRSTFVPGWAVPPRVLLVDDDAVSRRLSSKFLQVFGCAIDVAVDGVGAVNKMNLEKYDLVLMDIVMPKMDGISATSLIRQFDHVTPIISMTSNSRPSEIMTYYSSGMNDVLPKPFTKEGLLDMLEKHLMHLKVIQEMSRVPRIACAPRLSTDNSLTDALGADGNGNGPLFIGGVGTDMRIDPLAGMGLTEERYQAILKDLVNGDNLGVPEGEGMSGGMGMGEKRGLEEEQDGIREVKRGRFEVLD
ncbi:HSF-type DNA-binding-domain-containing protein [Pisolithus orientalis]|uniref:HSF-type DNA-binding-domain-containing protein n=1 Tax=Pisolithus orientalis TaxID=936130 RepID=UPI0022245D1F|nr:HSF-type DNA-binding-domain-containing protein [Pisolithus orientalis]KAI5997700.1 HSF-type DNA-binding-domain-containing protein [Pisolithus orientalis]